MPTIGPDVAAPPAAGFEHIVLDPFEVADSRLELPLHAPGAASIVVRQDGVDWGDAQIQAYMADLAIGSVPVDHRVPNREVKIPLMLGDEQGGDSFDQARDKLQSKVGRIQDEGGWLKRELKGGLKLYLDVVTATLKLGGGTAQAVHDLDADAELTLETIPDWYEDEIALGVHSGTGTLEWTETGIKGGYPGRLRVVVTNGSTNDQQGLIGGIRCRRYDSAATAAIEYSAQSRTPLDAAANATVAGTGVVQHPSLGTNWTPVLSTPAVSGGTHLTHRGTYRLFARVYSTAGSAVRVRALYDVGDFSLPAENDPWTIPGASNFYLADLGQVRIDPTTGTHRWQGAIQAEGTTGGEDVSIARLFFIPVDEGIIRLRATTDASVGLAGYSARDAFNQSSGNLGGKNLDAGGTWSTGGATTDFIVQTAGSNAHTAERVTVGDAGASPNVGRYATSTGGALTGQVVQCDVSRQPVSDLTAVVAQGLIARYVDSNNYLRAQIYQGFNNRLFVVEKIVGGTPSQLLSVSYGALSGRDVAAWQTLRLLVDPGGHWFLWWFAQGGSPGGPLFVGQDASLAAGGVLATGRAGIYDVNTSAGVAARRNYNNFDAWPLASDAVLFAGRSAELRWDGHFRQDSTGAAYGPISDQSGSDLVRIPPSGLEARPVEFYLKQSRGDLDQLPDPSTGSDPITAQAFYRPSQLFVPSS